MSRVRKNELQIDYTKKESIQWLFLNVLLYGMRGMHKVSHKTRYYGNFTETQLEEMLLSLDRVSFDDVISLADSLPDPMDGNILPGN